MIEVDRLTKRYRGRTAVDALSFRVEPGQVTGFLGPNGAGKTTTMRILLGLAAPSAGDALIGGRRYADLPRPMHEVGALLDPGAGYGGRRARTHLRCLATAGRIAASRVDAVLEQVGLAAAASDRIRTFSLGMRQRLGLAGALLGDPAVLVLDEPVNGLDPDGIRWIRGLLRELAAQGRTVLVSSHLMSEVEQTADRLVVVRDGRLLADTSVAELAGQHHEGVLVRSPRAAELSRALAARGGTVRPPTAPAGTASGTVAGSAAGAMAASAAPDDEILVTGLGAAEIGDLAASHGLPIWQIVERRASLEDAYLALTGGAAR